ncbi:dienelactone hydrolase family protein [Pilimelia columellifera]|uniref:Dienelactone hydrolase family protein n=1 Tax=Pilimelia columellifera subsp. columellifera TaxID=706583 RepID=A0ABN3NN44_9ACTN
MATLTATTAVPTAGVVLDADLTVPDAATGVVLFAHGSGSSRHSPRNRAVATTLNERGLATVLVDLLTAEEERVDARTAQLRFDIGLLAQRLTGVVDWLGSHPDTARHDIGLFGSSTGAAAALVTAARRPEAVRAVVSRGGRPDLAADALTEVTAPTLLVVGGLDTQVQALNAHALSAMATPAELIIVAGATHLFEEEGTLEQVAELASQWFIVHLGGPDPASAESR